MKDDRSKQLLKIRRNYRIEPSEDLLAFWKRVEAEKLNEQSLPYRFFNLRLLSREQVAEFDPKDFRFWFRLRPKIFLVQYYIPLAYAGDSSHSMMMACYDRAKHFIGVFLVNRLIDPVFITFELEALLTGTPPPNPTWQDFLKENVSAGLLVDCDPDPASPEEMDYDDKAIERAEAEKLTRLLEYLKLVYPVVQYEEKLDYKETKKETRVTFSKHSGPDVMPGPNLVIPKKSYCDLDTILPTLNLINYRLWNSNSNMMAEYGFYRTRDGVVMLHIEQLCEFVRWGVIPVFNNVHLPTIIHSSQPSSYRNALSYEVRFFETQEEYDQYYKDFMASRDDIFVHPMKEEDIPQVVDYFLNSTTLELSESGLDELLIPSEETLLAELQQSLTADIAEKRSFHMIFGLNEKTYAHARLERMDGGTSHLYFLHWEKAFRRENMITPWMQQTLDLIRHTYPELQTLIAEVVKEDTYRNEVLERAGFERLEEVLFQRDPLSLETTYVRWRMKL